MKTKRTLSLLLVFIITVLTGSATAVAATAELLMTLSDSSTASVELIASFNDFDGTAMSTDDGTTYSTEVQLEAGSYQFKIKNGEVEYGYPGTVKDTTFSVSQGGITFSPTITPKCTLVATGGTYTFVFNTVTCKLQVVKDGVIPEEKEDNKLTLTLGASAVTADVGDTVRYSVYLTADKAFEDIQSILSYNDEKLALVRIASEDSSVSDNEAEAQVYCPNIEDVVYNSDYSGVVAANASSVGGFDFTREKLLLTLDFKVLETGEASLELILQEMTATDGDTYYTFSTEVTQGVSLRETATVVSSAELPTEELAFSGASLTLHDNLCINFKANESLFSQVGYQNPYVVFELNGNEYTVTDYTVSGGKYIFDFSDIAPNNMNDAVKATLYASFDGVEYQSEVREYSVATYCYNMLNRYSSDEYAKLRTLLVDLLNYGAASQIYTEYNTQNLVNSQLTEAQRAWATTEKPVYQTVQNLEYKTVDNPTVQWKGGGLNLVDAVTMRFKIYAASYEGLTVRVETDNRIWEIPYEDFSETTGGRYVYFSGLNAGEMSETVYLTVYEGDKPVSNTVSYSIESYAYAKQNSQDTSLTSLLEAMMKYGNSAYAYVN